MSPSFFVRYSLPMVVRAVITRSRRSYIVFDGSQCHVGCTRGRWGGRLAAGITSGLITSLGRSKEDGVTRNLAASSERASSRFQRDDDGGGATKSEEDGQRGEEMRRRWLVGWFPTSQLNAPSSYDRSIDRSIVRRRRRRGGPAAQSRATRLLSIGQNPRQCG